MFKFTLSLFMLIFSSQIALAANWVWFEDDRFGVRAEVPAAGFTMQPPPINNDGRKWLMNGGDAEFSIFGSYMVVVKDFNGLRKFHRDILIADGITLSYTASGDGWFVQSGTKGNKIYYQKYSLNRNCNHSIVNGFTAVYSSNVQHIFAPIVSHISGSLSGGKNGFGC